MMDMRKHIAKDGWEAKRGPLSLSGQQLELELNREEVREGFFEVSSEDGKPAVGYVLCMEERMECLTSSFSGVSEINVGKLLSTNPVIACHDFTLNH